MGYTNLFKEREFELRYTQFRILAVRVTGNHSAWLGFSTAPIDPRDRTLPFSQNSSCHLMHGFSLDFSDE